MSGSIFLRGIHSSKILWSLMFMLDEIKLLKCLKFALVLEYQKILKILSICFFRIPKIWQILNWFAGSFDQVLTFYTFEVCILLFTDDVGAINL